MPDEKSAAEVARGLADALERAGIPYAIGGAIALGFYAVPRATVDVEVARHIAALAWMGLRHLPKRPRLGT